MKLLLEKILGIQNYNNFEEPTLVIDYCTVCIFYLPDTLKSLPRRWRAVTLNDEVQRLGTIELTQFTIQLREYLISLYNRDSITPIIVISNHLIFRLTDRLPDFKKSKVFLIDKELLNNNSKNIRDVPLVKAIRNKQSVEELAQLFFIPYDPKVPAEGWRFFGRKRELQTIIESSANFLIIGARQIGKTSLLRELERLLRDEGEAVHFIDLQYSRSAEEVISRIGNELDPREVFQLRKRHSHLIGHGDWFESMIKRIIYRSQREKIFLLLDELGNVINASRRGNWTVIGVLRKLSHEGKIKVIATGFQEILVNQFLDYSSPLINFARTLKLTVLNTEELNEFVVEPLGLWGDVSDGPKLTNYIKEKIGTHPLVLQYLGAYVFKEIFKRKFGTNNVLKILTLFLINERLVTYVFKEPVNELFLAMNSNVCRYLYLKFCIDATVKDDNLSKATCDDQWMKRELALIGFDSSFDERRFLFEQMELRGLFHPFQYNALQFKVSSPVFYLYISYNFSPLELLDGYKQGIKRKEITVSNEANDGV